MTCALLLTLTALPAVSASEHPAFHPADASLYLEVPDLAAVTRAYGNTSLLQLVGDAGVHRALGPLIGGERMDLQKALPQGIGDLLVARGLPSLEELPLSEMVGLSLSAVMPPSFFQNPDQARLQLVVQMTAPDSALSLAAMGEKAGLSAWQDGPFVALIAGPPLDPQTTPVAELEARIFGESPTLHDSPHLNSGAAHFSPAAGVTVLEGFSRVGEEKGGQESRGTWVSALGPLLEIARGTLGGNLGVLVSGGRFRMQLRGGRFVTESFRAQAEPQTKGVGIDTENLKLVSPESVIGGLVHVDPSRLTELFTLGSSEFLAAAADGVVDDLEERYGFHPELDLFAPLAGPVAFGLAPLKGLGAPDLRFVCHLRDSERFLRGLRGLTAMLADRTGESVVVTAKDYRKVPMFTLQYKSDSPSELPINLSGLIKPTFTVLPDRLIVTLSSRYAKDEVRRLTRNDAEGPSQAMSTLTTAALPEDAQEIGFADWLGLIARLYDSVKSLAPMAASFGIELPFDPDNLPESETFTRFFQPAFHYSRRVDGGLLTFSESSLGPEMPLLLATGATVALVPLVMSVVAPSAEQTSASPR